MKFSTLCVDNGGYSEQFTIIEKELELNAEEYCFYGREHIEHDEYSIEKYNPILEKVVTLEFDQPKV